MLEFVSPVHPIVPILNGLLGFLIHLNALLARHGVQPFNCFTLSLYLYTAMRPVYSVDLLNNPFF